MNDADQMAMDIVKQYLDRLFALLEKNQSMQLECFHALLSTDMEMGQFDRLLEFYENQGIRGCESLQILATMVTKMAEQTANAIIQIQKGK